MLQRIATALAIMTVVPSAGWTDDRLPLLDVFPSSVAATENGGQTSIGFQFTPSESLWDERLDESQVFFAELEHQQDLDTSFKLRIGRGGQIYSLRGPFGESVPPSWRAEGGHISPWNDEVWQFVAVCTTYNGVKASLKAGELPEHAIAEIENCSYENTFFIHNSGAYIPGDSELDSLYCPLLASEVGAERRCLRMVNWGLVPQIKTIHRSPLLFYMQVRDVGDGIIELTWVIHNFSVRDDVVFDHLNAPWGGTRISSLPLRYVSSPEGELLDRKDILNAIGVVDVRQTGGWNLSCASEADDSPSLALVFGIDRHLQTELQRQAAGQPFCQFKNSLYRDWRANAPAYDGIWKDWQTRSEASFRNYDVCEVIPKLRLSPQTTLWYRSYLVVGRKDDAIEKASSLVGQVDYGLLEFDAETTPLRRIAIIDGTVVPKASLSGQSIGFELPQRPLPGARPLFLIQHSETGQRIVTTDPYHFVKKEKLELTIPSEHPHHDYYHDVYGYSMDKNHSDWQSLLGFGYEQKPREGSWRQLSTLLDDAVFPPADEFHLDLWVKEPNDE